MPAKKKGKGKKKGKKSGKKKCTPEKPVDPLAPDHIVPPPKPGEKLINLLTSNPVDEKEIHGIKVSTRVLNELTAQEVRDLRTVFEIFDTDSDGFIDAVELRKSLRALGFKISKEDARRMIMDISIKGKGKVDFRDFLDTVLDRQGDSRDIYDEILKGFKMFDSDNSGLISMENLRQACKEAGIKFTQQELEDMIAEADLNGDGKVDESEFLRMMLQTNLF
ncbi:caltractin-like [Gigantopelta aegis]|uniref:caltractin-like n=1 Tax=Gigantopelta aegis TaxID=1735272 RepID=UPI001B88CD53|nr:caltractin-like [Gigantopelta aegis]